MLKLSEGWTGSELQTLFQVTKTVLASVSSEICLLQTELYAADNNQWQKMKQNHGPFPTEKNCPCGWFLQSGCCMVKLQNFSHQGSKYLEPGYVVSGRHTWGTLHVLCADWKTCCKYIHGHRVVLASAIASWRNLEQKQRKAVFAYKSQAYAKVEESAVLIWCFLKLLPFSLRHL